MKIGLKNPKTGRGGRSYLSNCGMSINDKIHSKIWTFGFYRFNKIGQSSLTGPIQYMEFFRWSCDLVKIFVISGENGDLQSFGGYLNYKPFYDHFRFSGFWFRKMCNKSALKWFVEQCKFVIPKTQHNILTRHFFANFLLKSVVTQRDT